MPAVPINSRTRAAWTSDNAPISTPVTASTRRKWCVSRTGTFTDRSIRSWSHDAATDPASTAEVVTARSSTSQPEATRDGHVPLVPRERDDRPRRDDDRQTGYHESDRYRHEPPESNTEVDVSGHVLAAVG